MNEEPNKTVHLLWFVPKEDEEELLIGIYTSEDKATKAIKRLETKSGFCDYLQGFQIHSRELDTESWTDGFVID